MTNVYLDEGDQLPPLPFWAARSTYAALLTAAATVASATGVDIFARFGTSEAGILHVVDAALPLLTLIWLWLERRSPKRRISLVGD